VAKKEDVMELEEVKKQKKEKLKWNFMSNFVLVIL